MSSLKSQFSNKPNRITNCFKLILSVATLQTTFAQCVAILIFEQGELIDANGGGGKQKYQLYCHILHARDVQGKGGMMPMGNYVPLLRWMNRVGLRSNNQKEYTKYVKKTTGEYF